MRQVEDVWNQHPEHCSLIWMLQIFELFQIFNELISLRRLSSTGGIEEVRVLSTNQTYVVGSSMVRGDFMSTRGILTVNLDRLRTQVQTVWIQHAVRPRDPYWTTPYSREFFTGYSTSPTGPNSQKHGFLPPGHDPPPREQKRGRPRETFTAAQPPLIFTKPLSKGENPFSKLRNAKDQTWPKLADALGKQRHVCFSSLFAPPFNQCDDPTGCGLRYAKTTRGAKNKFSRLHIDLADQWWSSSNYSESNWAPLVQFINENSDYIKPSNALKQLTKKETWN
jgi:hypothetical protein